MSVCSSTSASRLVRVVVWARLCAKASLCCCFVTADMPTSAIVNMPEGGSMKKFLLGHSRVTREVLSTFATDYFEGKLSANLKSEEIPADNSGPVKVLVGKNFNSIVLDETKDVLVEFYAPWCGHCKSLAPIYDELGELFSSVKSVVIAKIDATANEVRALLLAFCRRLRDVASVTICVTLLCRWITLLSTCVASLRLSSSLPAHASPK
jgi:protein disulfide isomerase